MTGVIPTSIKLTFLKFDLMVRFSSTFDFVGSDAPFGTLDITYIANNKLVSFVLTFIVGHYSDDIVKLKLLTTTNIYRFIS